MSRVKLTLSAEEELVALAKRLARSRGTSVSELFARVIRALGQERTADDHDLGPITRQASGLVPLRSHRSDRQLIEDALEEKYLRDVPPGV